MSVDDAPDPGVAYRCPECEVAAKGWTTTEYVYCEDCGDHPGAVCPECDAAVDLVFTDLSELVPAGPTTLPAMIPGSKKALDKVPATRQGGRRGVTMESHEVTEAEQAHWSPEVALLHDRAQDATRALTTLLDEQEQLAARLDQAQVDAEDAARAFEVACLREGEDQPVHHARLARWWDGLPPAFRAYAGERAQSMSRPGGPPNSSPQPPCSEPPGSARLQGDA